MSLSAGAKTMRKVTLPEKIHWHPEKLPGVGMLEAENCAQRWKVFHETYTICHVLKIFDMDSHTWFYKRRKYFGRPGGLMLMEPGEHHIDQNVKGSGTFWVIQLNPKLFEDQVRKGFLRGSPHLTNGATSNPDLVRAMSRLRISLKLPSSELEKGSRLAEVMRILTDKCCEGKPSSPIDPGISCLSRAKEYIRAHFSESIGFTELANQFGISLSNMDHLFVKYFGIAPKKYQAMLRVAEVRKQLDRGVPPSCIEAGFFDQAHLYRVFKQMTGVTPGEYQNGKPRISLKLQPNG